MDFRALRIQNFQNETILVAVTSARSLQARGAEVELVEAIELYEDDLDEGLDQAVQEQRMDHRCGADRRKILTLVGEIQVQTLWSSV